jgi:hypothetical protein
MFDEETICLFRCLIGPSGIGRECRRKAYVSEDLDDAVRL